LEYCLSISAAVRTIITTILIISCILCFPRHSDWCHPVLKESHYSFNPSTHFLLTIIG